MGLGCELSLSFLVLRAMQKKPWLVALVHVDTLADVNDEIFGECKTHGTVVRVYVKDVS
jgi:hypothetical protein